MPTLNSNKAINAVEALARWGFKMNPKKSMEAWTDFARANVEKLTPEMIGKMTSTARTNYASKMGTGGYSQYLDKIAPSELALEDAVKGNTRRVFKR
jgi:hypothetical protein